MRIINIRLKIVNEWQGRGSHLQQAFDGELHLVCHGDQRPADERGVWRGPQGVRRRRSLGPVQT